MPTPRLSVPWLEQLRLTIGSKLHIRLGNGELVISAVSADCICRRKKAHWVPSHGWRRKTC
ncbi:type I toxin-antitoxin system SymE family toxin [Xanthomonas pisi]|uniref:type I toxin-antitoxin system SymE family toxin n=1 Tax=Xanthomonas pisi TaxID=56457 RepID=UPI001FEB6FBF|nr:type I toxin-antitoxin system SymE family toxin [Xanthomonas pisi]